MGYCGDCEHLTIRHNCKKYKKGLAYSSYISRSISTGAMHERCSECDKDYRIAELEEKIKHQWIPVAERLPEIGEPVLITVWDKDVTIGTWYGNRWGTALRYNEDVLAWMPRPEPYRPQELEEAGQDAAAPVLQSAT